MVLHSISISMLALCLLAVLWLLGWPQVGSAAGTWSVISLPQKPGEAVSPTALAVDKADNLYVADPSHDSRIQERDARGNWAVLATTVDALGPDPERTALAVDRDGSLYVAEAIYATPGGGGGGRIQRRDAQGHWSAIASYGSAPGQVYDPTALAVDTAGNLYVADAANNRVLVYTPIGGP
jgi:DNA-binding beta-propeller fold protein YncE